METAKETKKNGKGKVTEKKATAKPIEAAKVEKPKAQAPKENAYSLARDLLAAGKSEKEIRKAVFDHLTATTDAKTALHFYAQRMSYRAVRRAKTTGKKEKAHASE